MCRWHCSLPSLTTHYPGDLALMTDLEKAWAPLVAEYLPPRPGAKVYRSDLQVLAGGCRCRGTEYFVVGSRLSRSC